MNTTRSFVALLCLLPALAWAEVRVDNLPLYSLRLDGDWTQRGLIREEDQYCLISRANDAQLTISGFDFQVKPGTLDRLAEGSMRFLMDRELKIHSRGGGTIDRHWTSPIPGGIQLNYEGSDKTGRAFRYAGLLFEHKLVNVYLEMPTRSAHNRASLLESILRHVKY